MRMLLTAVVVCVVCTAATVRAQPQPDEDLARAHFVTGRSYYDQGRFTEALREFKEAYRLSQRPGFLYNVGVCHQQLHQAAQAIDAFERYLAASPEAGDRADVQTRIDALRAEAAVTPVPAAHADRPVYKRGWFWGVMGGVAVVVAGGVAAGVVLGTRNQGTRTLMDVFAQ